MNTTIKNSLDKSISYEAYRALVLNYAQEGKTSGTIQTADYVNYTKLNESRMHRLDKTMQVIEELKSSIEKIDTEYIWLVITETWCGDAAQVIPVINKMAELSAKIELRIVLRDENEALMNLFLTNGTKSIPKLIILDKKTGAIMGDFGPRPAGATAFIKNYKSTHGIVDETAKIELQKWYLGDKGVGIQKEIMALMDKNKKILTHLINV